MDQRSREVQSERERARGSKSRETRGGEGEVELDGVKNLSVLESDGP